ncbi:hypothetical protein GIB67_032193 [Kingdonia uniflora]|uniref:BED-type domain-containing protein n=1 Tax=Kingdonia uniflora TaxID=39325 RepID=A0A7J7MXB3_9MAGN|nr:hypothetical protein GIB67_032193 [Kingdonia uniflora]
MDGEPVSKSRLKSLVWNDFERVKKGDVMAAICKHCKKRLSASATSGTSHLKNHLNRCRKRNIRDIGQQVLVVRGRQSFKLMENGIGNGVQVHFETFSHL